MGASGENDEQPVSVGDALVAQVEAIRRRQRERGPRRTSAQRVDWTTGEGQARLAGKMRSAGIPEQYRMATLERCRVQEDVEHWDIHAVPLIEAGRGHVIFGPVGTGKSSTAALLAAAAIRKGKSVKWAYVPDLCDRMLDQYRRQSVRAEHTLPDVLVLDDFGVRPFTNFEIGMLDQIVEKRYSGRKTMIVTTNLTIEQLGAPEFVRMRDRWRERCPALVIGGASMRGSG